MEILEKHGQADVFAYEALLNGYCKADIVDAANKVLFIQHQFMCIYVYVVD